MNAYILESCLTVAFPNITWRQDLLIPTPQLRFPYDKHNFCREVNPDGTTNVCLSWYPIVEATTYLVQWALNPDFNGPSVQEQIINAPTTEFCFSLPFQLRQSSNIYWRVIAANLTTGGVSNKSEVRELAFNCNGSSRLPTGCDEYAVNIEIVGEDVLDLCDTANYMSKVTYNCPIDNPLAEIQIKEAFWTYQYDGTNLSTQQGQVNSNNSVTIQSSVGDTPNLYAASLDVDLFDQQETVICFNIVFEFPNDITRPDFTCNGCKKVFIDGSSEGRKRLASLILIGDDTDDITPQTTSEIVNGDTELYLKGQVLRSTCLNKWECPNCECDPGKIAVDGITLEIGDSIEYFNSCCCPDGAPVTITLTDVNYLNDCTELEAIFDIDACGTVTQETLTFECCCNTETVSIGGTSLTVGNPYTEQFPCANCPPTNNAEARITLLSFDNSACDTFDISFNGEILCNGNPIEGQVFDFQGLACEDTQLTLDFQNGTCDHTILVDIVVNGIDPDTPQELTLCTNGTDEQKVNITRSAGLYEDQLNGQAFTPPCPCFPQELEATITVGGQTSTGTFFIDTVLDKTLVPTTTPRIILNGVTYELNQLVGDDNCNFLVRSNLPDADRFEPVTITECDPFEGTATITTSGETIEVSIKEVRKCSSVETPSLVTHTPLPIDCSMKHQGGFFGVDHKKLVNFPNGEFSIDSADDGCPYIEPKVCSCENGIKVHANYNYLATAQSMIPSGTSGDFSITTNSGARTVSATNLGGTINASEEVIVFSTESCELFVVSANSTPPVQCCDCVKTTLYALLVGGDPISWQVVNSVVSGGMVTHTIRLTCDADGVTRDIQLEALSCEVVDCKSLNLSEQTVGSCIIGVIYYGNDVTCAVDPADPPTRISCNNAPPHSDSFDGTDPNPPGPWIYFAGVNPVSNAGVLEYGITAALRQMAHLQLTPEFADPAYSFSGDFRAIGDFLNQYGGHAYVDIQLQANPPAVGAFIRLEFDPEDQEIRLLVADVGTPVNPSTGYPPPLLTLPIDNVWRNLQVNIGTNSNQFFLMYDGVGYGPFNLGSSVGCNSFAYFSWGTYPISDAQTLSGLTIDPTFRIQADDVSFAWT